MFGRKVSRDEVDGLHTTVNALLRRVYKVEQELARRPMTAREYRTVYNGGDMYTAMQVVNELAALRTTLENKIKDARIDYNHRIDALSSRVDKEELRRLGWTPIDEEVDFNNLYWTPPRHVQRALKRTQCAFQDALKYARLPWRTK